MTHPGVAEIVAADAAETNQPLCRWMAQIDFVGVGAANRIRFLLEIYCRREARP